MTQDRTPTLEEVISMGAMALLAERPSMFLARVEAYDRETQRADVSPVMKQFWGDGSGNSGEGDWREFSGVIPNLPVQFPSFGDWIIHGELQVGDYVMCVVSTRSIDEWLERGGVGVEPVDTRVRLASDAVVIPGVWPSPDKLAASVARKDELVLSKRDGSTQLRITGGGEIILTGATIKLGSEAASDPVALSTQTDSNLAAIVTELNKVIIFVNGLAPGTAIPITPQATVAATKVKGE